MSEFNNIAAIAAAIIVTAGFVVQAWGKWLDLQTARINKELARSKNAAAERQIESTSHTLSDTAKEKHNRRWLRRYLWREQREAIIMLIFLLTVPLLLNYLAWGNVTTPVFIWLVVHTAPMVYIGGNLVMQQVSAAYAGYLIQQEKK